MAPRYAYIHTSIGLTSYCSIYTYRHTYDTYRKLYRKKDLWILAAALAIYLKTCGGNHETINTYTECSHQVPHALYIFALEQGEPKDT